MVGGEDEFSGNGRQAAFRRLDLGEHIDAVVQAQENELGFGGNMFLREHFLHFAATELLFQLEGRAGQGLALFVDLIDGQAVGEDHGLCFLRGAFRFRRGAVGIAEHRAVHVALCPQRRTLMEQGGKGDGHLGLVQRFRKRRFPVAPVQGEGEAVLHRFVFIVGGVIREFLARHEHFIILVVQQAFGQEIFHGHMVGGIGRHVGGQLDTHPEGHAVAHVIVGGNAPLGFFLRFLGIIHVQDGHFKFGRPHVQGVFAQDQALFEPRAQADFAVLLFRRQVQEHLGAGFLQAVPGFVMGRPDGKEDGRGLDIPIGRRGLGQDIFAVVQAGEHEFRFRGSGFVEGDLGQGFFFLGGPGGHFPFQLVGGTGQGVPVLVHLVQFELVGEHDGPVIPGQAGGGALLKAAVFIHGQAGIGAVFQAGGVHVAHRAHGGVFIERGGEIHPHKRAVQVVGQGRAAVAPFHLEAEGMIVLGQHLPQGRVHRGFHAAAHDGDGVILEVGQPLLQGVGKGDVILAEEGHVAGQAGFQPEGHLVARGVVGGHRPLPGVLGRIGGVPVVGQHGQGGQDHFLRLFLHVHVLMGDPDHLALGLHPGQGVHGVAEGFGGAPPEHLAFGGHGEFLGRGEHIARGRRGFGE